MLIRILTLLFLFICYGFSCKECEDQISRTYRLYISNAGIKPVYQVGEVVNIPVHFPSLMECDQNELFDNSNGKVELKIQLLRIQDNNQDITDGLLYFEAGDSLVRFEPSSSRLAQLEGVASFYCNRENCLAEIPFKCLASGYYAVYLTGGSFGEYSLCENNHIHTTFFGENNNFSICNEINTTTFRITIPGTGGINVTNPEQVAGMHFFKVLD